MPLSDSTDRNADFIKQEVTRLQDMLNRLDFKRKVGTGVIGAAEEVISSLHDLLFSLPSGDSVKNGRRRQGDRRPDDLSAQSRAAGLEEAPADCRHRRSTADWAGPAAELVFRLLNALKQLKGGCNAESLTPAFVSSGSP